MEAKPTSFNIRVYGILPNKKNEVLLSDEYEFGMKFTKFPGGGMKLGEGTLDCLKRECIEELGQEVETVKHFFTTDFFQQSAFNPKFQIISIYYLIRTLLPPAFRTSGNRFDFPGKGTQSLRWAKINSSLINEVTFPIDKKVAALIAEEFSQSQ